MKWAHNINMQSIKHCLPMYSAYRVHWIYLLILHHHFLRLRLRRLLFILFYHFRSVNCSQPKHWTIDKRKQTNAMINATDPLRTRALPKHWNNTKTEKKNSMQHREKEREKYVNKKQKGIRPKIKTKSQNFVWSREIVNAAVIANKLCWPANAKRNSV